MVHLVDVDVVGLQALQRCVARAADVERRQLALVRPLRHVAVQLRREDGFLPTPAAAREPVANDVFGQALVVPAVNIRGVEEVDAELVGAVHDVVTVGDIGHRTEVHGPEAEAADAEAGAAKVCVIHVSNHFTPATGRWLAASGCVWQPAAMGMGRTARGAAALTAVVVVVLSFGARAQAVDSTLLFKFADSQIDESSGLGTSSYGDGIVYTHNDSGDTARFFAVNSSGATVAIYTLKGATAHDWEDMETGTDASGKPVLYFGDIGDNSAKRTEIDVYQVPEPRGPSANVPWIRYRFAYPDGPHNAETLMVDPHTHRIFIASKAAIGDGLLYEAPAVLSTTAINKLAVVVPQRTMPMLTTSGDISPDGKLMVLLTYFAAYWSAASMGSCTSSP